MFRKFTIKKNNFFEKEVCYSQILNFDQTRNKRVNITHKKTTINNNSYTLSISAKCKIVKYITYINM